MRRVQMRLGKLHGIVSDSLRFCFELAAQETTAANAQLDIEEVVGEEFMVDAVELDDGWRYRPEANACA